MNAEYERRVQFLEMLGYRFVGYEHKFFDHFMREKAFAAYHVDDLFAVHHDFAFPHVEFDRTARGTLCHKKFGKRFSRRQHRHKEPVFNKVALPVQKILHALVSGTRRRTDNTFADFVRNEICRRVETHNHAERESVHALVERTNAVGKFFGQHRNNAVGKIHARAALERLAVEYRPLGNVLAYVRDVNAEKVSPVVRAFDGNRVVEVLAVRAVDGYNRIASEIASTFYLFRRRIVGKRVRRPHYFFGERFGDSVHSDNAHNVRARLAGLAENLGNKAFESVAGIDEFRHDLVALVSVRSAVCDDARKRSEPALGANDRRAVVHAHDLRIFAFEDFNDFALSAAAMTRGFTYENAIAVNRSAERACGNKHVRLARFGDKERKAFARSLNSPRDGRTVL